MFHVKPNPGDDAPPAGLEGRVSRETLTRLHAFRALLLHWTARINLIAPSTRDRIWQRHIADSEQLWRLAPLAPRSWLDLGSGGGLPGLVVAILAREEAPELRVVLVESDRRKAAFLRQAAQQLDLPAKVLAERIERVALPPQDVISARALAPLEKLLGLAHRFRHENTVLLFPKGRQALSELTEARRHWHIEAEVVPSRTDDDGAILRIFEVEPRK